MADYGLLPTGYYAPRGNDLLLTFRQSVEGNWGVTVDWSPDTAWGALSEATAALVASVSEASQAVWDGMNRNNAQQAQLDQIGALVGVYRKKATYSTVVLTLTGTTGTIIPSGSLVQGGGTEDTARWRITENVTISGGSATTTATCTETGAITAEIGQIDQIVTPVYGWSTVTNAAIAVSGNDIESDADYRIRQVTSLQISGTTSVAALRAQLLQLETSGATFIESCVVLENDDSAATTIGGLSLPGHSFAAVIYPSTLTSDEITSIAETIFANQVPGTYSAGPLTTDASGVATTVTGQDGFPHYVRWYWAQDVAIPVVITLTLRAGYALADVQTLVENAVIDYFNSLAVGEPAYLLSVLTAVKAASPSAIIGCSATLDGVSGDYTPEITEIITIDGGTPTVTT